MNSEKQKEDVTTGQPNEQSSTQNESLNKDNASPVSSSKEKDESDSYMDYNGNSEQNAPVRSS